eukprot:scaffold5653_cov136-Isochrysis_galbana.AAC.5
MYTLQVTDALVSPALHEEDVHGLAQLVPGADVLEHGQILTRVKVRAGLGRVPNQAPRARPK